MVDVAGADTGLKYCACVTLPTLPSLLVVTEDDEMLDVDDAEFTNTTAPPPPPITFRAVLPAELLRLCLFPEYEEEYE